MNRLIIVTLTLAAIYYYTADQRQFAADLWRDARYHVEMVLTVTP